MLESGEIKKIVVAATNKALAATTPLRIIAEPTTDSEGNSALRVVLVLTQDAVEKVTGDETLDVLVDIQRRLQSRGEERLVTVEYATEAELGPGDDQEPPPAGNE